MPLARIAALQAVFPGYFAHWEMGVDGAGRPDAHAGDYRSHGECRPLSCTPEDLGTLEKNKWADLLVLDKDPLDDIKNTRTISAVYIAGKNG